MIRTNNISLLTSIIFSSLVCIMTLSVEAINSTPVFQSNKYAQPDTVNSEIKMGRDANYRLGKADSYLMIANIEDQNENFVKALRYYLSAIYELEIISDSLRIADTKVLVGNIFSSNELLDNALEYYSTAELIYLQLGIISDYNDLLIKIGNVYYSQKNYKQALQYFNRASLILKDSDNKSLYINSLFRIVQCYTKLSDHNNALDLNLQILEFYRIKKDISNEIIALNNVGFTYKNIGDYEKALEYLDMAGDLENKTEGIINPVSLVNKAIVFQNMGDNEKAISYLNDAAKVVDNLKDKKLAAEYNYLTALVYFNLKDYHNALIYNNSSIVIGEEIEYSTILEDAYFLSSKIYEAIYNYEEAMVSFQKHLIIKDSIRRNQIYSQQEINAVTFRIERISRETESLWASEELSYLELQRLKLDSANRQQQLDLFYQSDSIQKITIENQQLENARAMQALLLKEETIYAQRKEKEVDSLRQIEKIQSLELETQQLVQKEQEAQIVLLDKENQIAELNLKKIKTRNNYLIAFAVLAILVIYLVYRGLRYAKKTNKVLIKQKNEIERQKDEIEYERKRSDKLLLNILPEETAEELKEKGSATPKHYDKVSVLFTDFKGFTLVAEKLTPQELVAELNNCFLEFDKIIDKHGLEKIKTIGDAYMCAGGIPVANETNPVDIVLAGLEIKEYMNNLKAERESKGEDFWELRIGIHTGAVVAGVVGKNKFAYDIWGDAVNTASRMESSGIPAEVNISGKTFELVKDKFNCTYRGKIKAKNKGEIDMYLVEGILE